MVSPHLSRWLAPLSLVAAVVLVLPRPALACGGCFGPPAPPGALPGVLQTAERVLFVHDPPSHTTRVWIEIRYDGPAKDFAWVLPLPAVPKVGVGSSWIFDRLDLATAPRFRAEAETDENCAQYVPPAAQPGSSPSTVAGSGEPPRPESLQQSGGGCGGGGLGGESIGYQVSGAPAGTGGGSDGGGGESGTVVQSTKTSADGRLAGVDLLDHDQVGPYEYDVVEGKDPALIVTWLEQRGYAVPKQALPIIAAHVAKGDVFLALRLKSDAGVQEIRPVALEMTDADPCVPLRLTSIAAVEDTSVVVYVAGPGRAVPKNYLHVVVNPAKLAWVGGVDNYGQVLSAALDEAGGHAFATEYSGATTSLEVEESLSLVRRQARYGSWKALYEPGKALILPGEDFQDFATVTTAAELVQTLGFSGILLDDALAAAFEDHAGLAEALGYASALACYNDLQTMQVALPSELDASPVNGKALAASLAGLATNDEPVEEIAALIDAIEAQPKLTRLAMLISPDEMTKDPIFAFHPSLPSVDGVFETNLNAVCLDGWYPANGVRMTLPGLGSWVFPGEIPSPWAKTSAFASNTKDPRFVDAPFALRIELLDEWGSPAILVPTQALLVDAAIAGAQPGTKSLPAGMDIDIGTAWSPPPSDPLVTERRHASGGFGGPFGARETTLFLLLLAAAVLASRTWRRG